MLNNFTTFVVAIAVAASASVCVAQDSGTSPVYRLQAGENSVKIYEKFTTVVEHTARIKSVLDFDDEVIKIDPVHGHPNQVTIYALTTGVTTVTIVDELGQQLTIEVLVRGDVRHLESYIQRLYPNDSIQIEEIKGSVRLSGWVTKPAHINHIVSIAEQFYPSVMNHMETGGVQQVMLRATIMEVNRSKLRRMGINLGLTTADGFFNSTPGPITPITGITATAGTGAQVAFSGFNNTSVSFGFINPTSVFQGFVDALRTEGLLKIHATPMLTTHNGQPAELLNGGEAPVIVPAGLGTTAIEFKPFGTIMNAVPHILGNGRLKLQIDASVVERDFANSVTVDGITVPSFTVRKVNTAVEMNFGETLVIGGLIQKRETASTAKLPFFGELPVVGAAFRQTQYTEAETELLILVTPDYVSAMSADQVPAGGPGLFTDTVTDNELFKYGMIEVPKTGPECSSIFNCSECGQGNECRCGSGRRGNRAAGRNARRNGGGAGYGYSSGFGGGAGCTDCGPVLIQPTAQQETLPMTGQGNSSTRPISFSRDLPVPKASIQGQKSSDAAGHSGSTGLIAPKQR